MGRKEKLLHKLQNLRLKLNCRRIRFQARQKEIEELDMEGYATVKDLEKSLRYWVKEQRLNDRIEYIDSQVSKLTKVLKEAI